MSMILFYKCISIEVKEEAVNPNVVFAANFMILKIKVNKVEKLRSDEL